MKQEKYLSSINVLWEDQFSQAQIGFKSRGLSCLENLCSWSVTSAVQQAPQDIDRDWTSRTDVKLTVATLWELLKFSIPAQRLITKGKSSTSHRTETVVRKLHQFRRNWHTACVKLISWGLNALYPQWSRISLYKQELYDPWIKQRVVNSLYNIEINLWTTENPRELLSWSYPHIRHPKSTSVGRCSILKLRNAPTPIPEWRHQ